VGWEGGERERQREGESEGEGKGETEAERDAGVPWPSIDQFGKVDLGACRRLSSPVVLGGRRYRGLVYSMLRMPLRSDSASSGDAGQLRYSMRF
jgi:hypothetical protein